MSTTSTGGSARTAAQALRRNKASYTLAEPIVREGVGLHSGQITRLRLCPEADASRGRYFVRVDLPEQPEIPARLPFVGQTVLSTELMAADGEATVRTVEHLLAALVAAGVTAARLELDGPEVPLLDGSAAEWWGAIAQAGLQPLASLPSPGTIQQPIWVRDQTAFVAALPSPVLRFSYGIEFAETAIGTQWHSWTSGHPDFAQRFEATGAAGVATSFGREVAPARTFGLARQVEQLRAAGLIRGGSLDNALVCGPEGWLNPPLRFANEPARHKILDLVGDLSLLGEIPTAHYLAFKASHRLHSELAIAIAHQTSRVPARS